MWGVRCEYCWQVVLSHRGQRWSLQWHLQIVTCSVTCSVTCRGILSECGADLLCAGQQQARLIL